MNPKDVIIYSDLDGTLLSYANGQTFINEKNGIAIKKWMALGGGFSIATGRNLKSILPFFSDIQMNYPMVLSNGAMLYSQETNRVIHEELLPLAFIEEALMYFRHHKFVSLVLSDCFEIYTIDELNLNRPELNFPSIHLPLNQVDQYALLKISFVVEASYSDQIIHDLKQFKSYPFVHVSASSKRYIEVVSKKATKALGIQKVLEINQITSKKLVCIGDYLNDYEMLEMADFAACPANSHEEVMKLASIKTIHHNEGAIADLIHQLINL